MHLHHGNLRRYRPLTPLLGRGELLATTLARLDTSDMVIIGPGGIGKTHFVTQVAATYSEQYGAAVWFFPFADANSVDEGLRQAFADQPFQSRMELYERLSEQHTLVILDNCEHLTEEVELLTWELQSRCPNLRIIATSRQTFAIANGRTIELPPLTTGHAGSARSLSPAAELFIARAALHADSEELDASVDDIEQICNSLDGIPLAIELAAARLSVITVGQLRLRIAESLRVLASRRSGNPRQRTMAASVQWSYDLCSKSEQELWARLTMFAGPFTLAAVEYMARGIDGIALDLIQALVEKSVVGRRIIGDESWFSFLVPIREYGAEQLRAVWDAEAAAALYVEWIASMSQDAEVNWATVRQAEIRSLLFQSHPDVNRALEIAFSTHELWPYVYKILISIWRPLWLSRGRLSELESLLERASALPGEPTNMVVETLYVKAYLSMVIHGVVAASADFQTARDAAKAAAYADQELLESIVVASNAPTSEAAIAAFEALVPRVRVAQRVAMHTRFFPILILLHDRVGNAGRTRELEDEYFGSDPGPRDLTIDRAYVLYGRGVNAFRRGDLNAALTLSRGCVNLGSVLLTYNTAYAMETIAAVQARRGRSSLAAQILGAADTIWAIVGHFDASYLQFPLGRQELEVEIRRKLDDQQYHAAHSWGRRLSPREGLVLASGQISPRALTRLTTNGLTGREAEVLEMLLEGATNKEIGERLFLSTRTAEGHVHNVLKKMQVKSRAELLASQVAARRSET